MYCKILKVFIANKHLQSENTIHIDVDRKVSNYLDATELGSWLQLWQT